MYHRFVCVLIAGMLVLPAVTMAQPALPQRSQNQVDRFERQLEEMQRDTRVKANVDIPADQRLLLDFGGSFTFSFASIDDTSAINHLLWQYNVTTYARANLDNVHEFFIRGSATFRDFAPGDSFDGKGDDWVGPNLDRAVYRFDLRQYLAAYEGEVVPYHMSASIGRQLVHWANGLVLSEQLDGGVFTVGYDALKVDILASTTRQSITDIDASRPNPSGDTERDFFGAIARYQLGEKHRPFIYGVYQGDRNDQIARTDTIGGVPITTSDFEYDSWYIGVGSEGSLSDRLLYGVEFAYQGGNSMSSPFTVSNAGVVSAVPQTSEDINAWALDMRLDYLFTDANNTRLSAEVLLASGDRDRLATSDTLGGNQSGTSDNAFNAFGLVDTGLAFAPRVSNLVMLRLGASTIPFPTSSWFRRMQVGTNVFIYHKLYTSAPISEATTDDSYLGVEPDIYVNWQVASDVSLGLRYGVFFPGTAIIGGGNDPRHFLFTSLTLAF